MTYATEDIQCPCCKKNISIKLKASETRAGYNTDLSCIGACSTTLPYNMCEKCQYIFYDIDVIKNNQFLKKFIFSNKYKELLKKYLFTPYYLIYLIYKECNLSKEDKLLSLLFNYYDRKTLDNFKILTQEIESSLTNDMKFAMLRGEYYRRTEEFDKAKEIFLDIKKQKNHGLQKHCDFQLKLIKKQDNRLQRYCFDKTPNYSRVNPVLDGEILKNQEDSEIINEYIFSFKDSLRYDEFEQGLTNLKKAQVDLQASDDEGNMLHAILYLMVYTNGDCLQEKIKHIFDIALLKYNIDPSITAITEYNDCPDTLTEILKEEILWEFGQRENQQFVDDIREAIYEYSVKLILDEKVGFLPLEKQQVLLITQLPYFEKVKSLLEMGFLFDKKFFENSECFDNIIDYTQKVGCSRTYSEFYEQEFPKLYELIVFLIENAIPNNYDNDKILQSVEKFKDENVYQKVQQYLSNISTVHRVKIKDIDKGLPQNGIKKISFQAKIFGIKERYNKKKNKFYLIDFIDENKNTVTNLRISNNEDFVNTIKKYHKNQKHVRIEAVLKNFSDGDLSIVIENIQGVEGE